MFRRDTCAEVLWYPLSNLVAPAVTSVILQFILRCSTIEITSARNFRAPNHIPSTPSRGCTHTTNPWILSPFRANQFHSPPPLRQPSFSIFRSRFAIFRCSIGTGVRYIDALAAQAGQPKRRGRLYGARQYHQFRPPRRILVSGLREIWPFPPAAPARFLCMRLRLWTFSGRALLCRF